MNNLSDFYRLVKDFCDNHNMINEFILLSSLNDIDNRVFDYRTLILVPSRSNISRDLNRPIYTLSFDCALLDKCPNNSESASVHSIQENLFVVGQLQDYLIQQDENCYFDEVEVQGYASENDNITAALFEVTMSFARKGYNTGIDNA